MGRSIDLRAHKSEPAPRRSPAMFPYLTGNVKDGEDDDEFGDFMSFFPLSSSHSPSICSYPTPALLSTAADDNEEWGDFFSSSFGSPSPQLHSSSPFSPPLDPIFGDSPRPPWPPETSHLGYKEWEKSKEAIPLYIFGDEDAKEQGSLERPGIFENGFSFYSFSSQSSQRSAPTGKLNDLLESLYVQDGSAKEKEDMLDEGSWEFKDAFSPETRPELMEKEYGAIFGLKLQASANENGRNQGGEIKWNMGDIDDLKVSAFTNEKNNSYGNSDNHVGHNTGTLKMVGQTVVITSVLENLYKDADIPQDTLPSHTPINNVLEIDQHCKASAYVTGDINVDQLDWEFQNAVEAAETADAKNDIYYDSWQIMSSESPSYTLLEFYCRLKEKSLALMVHHLAILKVSALPGATSEVKNINKEIQDVYGNLQEMMASEDACTCKKIAIHINELLNATKTSNFQAVEHEYSLSKRLLAAEKDLNTAVELFVHSSSVLHTLRLATKEEQLFYINAWSMLASACAQELQLGAKIWTESLDNNVSKQLLIKGNKYFIALGEVFRVSRILKATLRFYMPWLLSNMENSSEILICLEKGNDAWINSGLEETLQTISVDTNLDDKGFVKPLLESINLVDEFIGPTYPDFIHHDSHEVCKFFLLPFNKLPEIKTVVWNGDCYVTKLVNFWANRISPDPPELPSIILS